MIDMKINNIKIRMNSWHEFKLKAEEMENIIGFFSSLILDRANTSSKNNLS